MTIFRYNLYPKYKLLRASLYIEKEQGFVGFIFILRRKR